MIKFTITPNNFPEIVKKELERLKNIADKILKEMELQIKRDPKGFLKSIEEETK